MIQEAEQALEFRDRQVAQWSPYRPPMDSLIPPEQAVETILPRTVLDQPTPSPQKPSTPAPKREQRRGEQRGVPKTPLSLDRESQKEERKSAIVDIVEEITLDDHSGESSTAETNGVPHVETVNNTSNDTLDDQRSPFPAKQNETLEAVMDAKPKSPVETEEHDAVVSIPPPEIEQRSPDVITTKEAVLKINRLRPVDIDVWTDIVHKYYEFVPSPVEMVKITNVQGYGLRSAVKCEAREVKVETSYKEPVPKKTKDTHPPHSGPSPEHLLAHANALIQKVNQFVTKPVNAKFGETTGRITDQTSGPHVETANDENPSSQVETSASESEPLSVKPTKPKSHRTMKCKISKGVFKSIRDLNDHHKDDHGVVGCDLCDKKFETMSALEKHNYLHQDLKYIFKDCGQSYPFQSRLKQHRIVHQNTLNFMCKHTGCTRGFKKKSDYNRHLQSHLEGWYWCDTCTYKNKDKRNHDSHMRIHQQQGIGLERYVCKHCGKAMHFNTQLCCHKQSGCQIIDLSVQKDTAKQSNVMNNE